MTMACQRDMFLSPTSREIIVQDRVAENGQLRAQYRAGLEELEDARRTIARQRSEIERWAAAWSDLQAGESEDRKRARDAEQELRRLRRNKERADRYATELTADNRRLQEQIGNLTEALAAARNQTAAAAPPDRADRRTIGNPADGDDVRIDRNAPENRPGAVDAPERATLAGEGGDATVPQDVEQDDAYEGDRFRMLEMD